MNTKQSYNHYLAMLLTTLLEVLHFNLLLYILIVNSINKVNTEFVNYMKSTFY